jgi:prepilin-type N-terminal cleavage/methylation domain-containing protein
MNSMKTFGSQSGFTLIEMIVALAVFAVVITISVGALLMLIVTNQQLQAEQSVMTNLSFALDSMTREIRTGTRYFCGAGNSRTTAIASMYQIFSDGEDLSSMGENTRDCYDGRGSLDIQGIAFIEGGQSITNAPDTRIVYFFDEGDHKLYRRISGEAAQPIVSSGIYIEDAEFFVTGSDPRSDGDDTQATVTIYIKAREASSTVSYEMQTTINQRTLDI